MDLKPCPFCGLPAKMHTSFYVAEFARSDDQIPKDAEIIMERRYPGRMYDELVKRLRENANDLVCTQNCYLECSGDCILKEAADAIEKLSKQFDDMNEANTALYSALPKWIPVEERLPENLTSVIVHRKDGGIFMWEYFNTSPTDECWIDDSMNVYSFYDVTHWMPLPTPPKEG